MGYTISLDENKVEVVEVGNDRQVVNRSVIQMGLYVRNR